MSADDHAWMARALRLARKGLYSTHPNPRVGCVIVKDGELIGEGWHVRAGEPHAEVHALRQAGERDGSLVLLFVRRSPLNPAVTTGARRPVPRRWSRQG